MPEKTSFVGRASDLAAIDRAIDAGARLLTLTGPGGIGKTRLARRWATANTARFESVVACDLTEARTERDVVALMSAALGADVHAVESIDEGARELGRALDRRGEVLVVIDNLEQIASHAATAIAAWLDAAPAATFLATSRERIGIEGEHRHELGPLAEVDAIGLFVARASAAGIDGATSPDDRATVARIVERLEGVPLAIELAAPRATALGLPALLARIGEGVAWLASDRRDATSRQSTLHAAIAWSWGLLSSAEQRALARCAVFRGGFSARAVEVVVGGADAIDVMQSLRNKSLVRAIDGEARLGLYESVREYASAALDASGERADAEALHAAHFLAERPIDAADLHNLVAAHAWCLRHDAPSSVRALDALAPPMKARGAVDAMLDLVDASVAALETSPDRAALAEALAIRGEVQRVRGRMAEAATDLERAIGFASREASPAIHARAQSTLALVRWSMGREDEARRHADAALALFAAHGDRAEEGMVRCLIARLRSSDLAEALAQLERALGLERDAGHVANEAVVLVNMGAIAHEHGLLPRASEHFEAALVLLRRTGDRRMEATALARLGQIAMERGDDDAAAARYADALATFEAIGARRDEAIVLSRIGALALHRGRPAEAHATLERALDRLRGRGDRYEGLCQAWLAATLTIEGAHEEAAARMKIARGLVDAVSDEGHVAALRCLEAIVARAAVGPELADAARTSSDARIALRVAQKLHARGAASPSPAPTLVVAPDARWFEAPGSARVDLSRRRALRLLLHALTERRHSAPGAALSLDDLVATGWPGERIAAASGARRAYTAIASLRDMGLRNVLIRHDDGYLLDPKISVERRDRE